MDEGVGDVLWPIRGDFVSVSPRPESPSSVPARGKCSPMEQTDPKNKVIGHQTSWTELCSDDPPFIQSSPASRRTCTSHPSDRSIMERGAGIENVMTSSEGRSSHSPHERRTIAERRRHEALPQLNVRNQQPYQARDSRRISIEGPVLPDARPQTPAVAAPAHHVHDTRSVDEQGWESESVYSSDTGPSSAHVSPLKLHPRKVGREPEEAQEAHGAQEETCGNSIFRGYHDWKKSAAASPAKVDTAEDSKDGPRTPLATELYSPLTPYFEDKNQPVIKKGSKVLIGQNGWLERTGKTPEKKKDSHKKSMLDSLKKMAREMAPSSRRTRDGHKAIPNSSSITLSLDPREQSLIYCELEFYLSCAIHGYITVQLNHGRLDPDKLKKVADSWAQKGRPKVVGFRYDLETQLELISLHSNDFRFFGHRQANEAEITGLLHTMKVNARAMRIRTFCQPDLVIAKQLVDAQAFFSLLGVPEVQQIALHQVSQFFKVIVERERHRGNRLDRNGVQPVSDLVSYQWERDGERATCEPKDIGR